MSIKQREYIHVNKKVVLVSPGFPRISPHSARRGMFNYFRLCFKPFAVSQTVGQPVNLPAALGLKVSSQVDAYLSQKCHVPSVFIHARCCNRVDNICTRGVLSGRAAKAWVDWPNHIRSLLL